MTKYGMAIENQNPSSSEVTSNMEVPITNNHSMADGVPLQITGHKLNGNNYLQWSQSVLMYIRGKGRDEYLTGEVVPPDAGNPKFKTWKIENNMVMSWLVNSMTNEIGENFLLYNTAHEIWDAAKEFFSSKENTAEVFEIETSLHDLRQGDFSVTQYYNLLTRQWQRLDVFEEHQWTCAEDSKKFREIVEKKRIFKFLMGLNKNLDEVRGRILGMKPLPNIREVFSEVRREESRKKVMLGEFSTASVTENSALAARGTQHNNSNNNRQKKGRPWCDHCRKPGHTRDNCWKIHGKPADWKSTRSTPDKESRGNQASINEESPATETSPFSKEQIEALQKMFSQ